MEFLGVGPAELVVILIVALVFVGPERLPKLAADIARTIREIRKYTSGIAAEFNEVVKDFENDTKDERSAWKEIGEGLSGATKSMTDAVRSARADAEGRTPSAAPEAPAPTTPTSGDAPASLGATTSADSVTRSAGALVGVPTDVINRSAEAE